MTYDSNTPSILWHDYETWGVSPKYDKPSQFAGIRTDLDLNIISEPEVFYCQPPQDYLPQPEACLVTGITPQKAQREGLTEAEFASRIHALFSQPNTCVAGYNNIRFDDEVTRYMFYRNFYDPYAREWQHGNSRWDIIDMVRACYALRPEGINWPTNDEGKVSFRLELLTKANGISHEAAHDAMSDVYATIAMAKLIKEKQPKLYDFIFNLKNKRQVAELIDVYNMTPIVHTSSRISSEHGCTSWFAPVSYHPTNKNAVIAVDLAQDPEPLLNLSSEDIKARLYTKRQDLAEGELPIPVKLIHINKCPVVSPAKTLLPENAARLNIPREQCLANLTKLKGHDALRDKLSDVFMPDFEGEEAPDAEHALYGGEFFSASDKAQMEVLHAMPVEQLAGHDFQFQDPRLPTLLFRYRARNFPLTLTSEELQKWQQYSSNKLQYGGQGILSLDEYMMKLENLAMEHENNPEKMAVLKALFQYVQS
ncbi:exodeoxyribonuclease I [Thalassomonas actiniarum]|uniref:Exodeoxyribonuclease I n=1 Tax=Thalassomonas actiniarum TaxID=485447 RepID=A0AAE9YIW4_9GAMM|nr:exodeoxyribonuclease I [Thalassomonas actiniarum]WDD96780.1 exodeoxyribonuclease I [Thalassomonas actiniarum]